jgi:hypothetical protein
MRHSLAYSCSTRKNKPRLERIVLLKIEYAHASALGVPEFGTVLTLKIS